MNAPDPVQIERWRTDTSTRRARSEFPATPKISGGNLADHKMHATGTFTSSTTRFPAVADRCGVQARGHPAGSPSRSPSNLSRSEGHDWHGSDRRIVGGVGGGPSTGRATLDNEVRRLL
jgi:hypothetical protein